MKRPSNFLATVATQAASVRWEHYASRRRRRPKLSASWGSRHTLEKFIAESNERKKNSWPGLRQEKLAA